MKKIVATLLLVSSLSSYAGTLHFQWEEPVSSYIGTTLSYNIRWGDGTNDQIVNAVGTTHSVEVADEPAVYYAQIRTVESHEDGDILYSEWSPVITSSVVNQKKEVPSAPSLTIRFECDGCSLVVD